MSPCNVHLNLEFRVGEEPCPMCSVYVWTCTYVLHSFDCLLLFEMLVVHVWTEPHLKMRLAIKFGCVIFKTTAEQHDLPNFASSLKALFVLEHGSNSELFFTRMVLWLKTDRNRCSSIADDYHADSSKSSNTVMNQKPLCVWPFSFFRVA